MEIVPLTLLMLMQLLKLVFQVNLKPLLEFLIHIQKNKTRQPPIFMISTVMDLQT